MVIPYDKSKNIDEKVELACIASKYVNNHSVIGLGSGSTMELFVDKLAMRIKKESLSLKFVVSSKKIEKKAIEKGFTIIEISEVELIDQAFDGADRIDSYGNLIKGGGGSLFRERQLLLKAKEKFILADESKKVHHFESQIVPVEVVPFNAEFTLKNIEKLNLSGEFRFVEKEYFVTDNGNYIIDLKLSNFSTAEVIYKNLKLLSGIVEVGIFLNDDYNVI